jgi:bifunctional non-homologous end joining protein LigD
LQLIYEIKHDGYRFICRRDGERVRVFSRRGNDRTDRVPLIAEALTALKVKSVTIDGEGVVCREDGVSDFERLRTSFCTPLTCWTSPLRLMVRWSEPC